MIVAARLLRDRRRSTLWWSIAIVLIVLSYVAVYPSVKGDVSVDTIIEDMPAALRAFLGSQAEIPLSSAPGYLQARMFSTTAPLVLLIFGIGLGARALGATEEDGTLELLLANPVSRRRVVVERVAAVVALVAVLTAVFAASVLVMSPAVGMLDGVSVPGLVFASCAAGALGLLHAAIAFAAGAWSGRRTPAVVTGSAVAIAGYLLHGFATTTDLLHPFRFVTPWHWYLGRNMLVQGVAVESLVLPLGLAAVIFTGAVLVFERRDLR